MTQPVTQRERTALWPTTTAARGLQKMTATFRATVNRGFYGAALASWLRGYLLSFGTLVLLLRLLNTMGTAWLIWIGGMGFLTVLFLAQRQAKRQFFSDGEARAWLDHRANAGGLFLITSEAEEGYLWRKRVEEALARLPALPRFAWRHWLAGLLLRLLFCVGVFWVEGTAPRHPRGPGYTQARIDETKKELQKLTLLELLPKEKTEPLKEELQKLEELAKSKGLDAGDKESLDHVSEKIEALKNEVQKEVAWGKETAQELAAAEWNNEKNEAAGEKNSEGEKDSDENASTQKAREAVNQYLEELRKKELLDTMLPEVAELLDAEGLLEEGKPIDLSKLKKVQWKKLTKALKKGAKCNCRKACRGEKTGEPDSWCESDGEGDEEDMDEAFLAACQAAKENGSDAAAACANGGDKEGAAENAAANNSTAPGNGGVSRGRGDAPLTLGAPSDASKIHFKPEQLPPGTYQNPDGSLILKELRGAPVPAKNTEAIQGVERLFEQNGSDANRRALPPRYRETVKNYFQGASP